jgi:pimeloyl-ACP methyl ester carboxylesterase
MPLQTIWLRNQSYQFHRDGSGDPTLLFVHGFPLNHSQWQAQLEHFGTSHCVIAPDLRGLGGSPVVSADDAIVTMEQHADDLAAMLDQLKVDQPVVFIGLSMGGYIAWQFVRKYAARLRALVLCHTRTIGDNPAQATARHNLAAQTLKEQSSQAAEAQMLPRLLPASASPALVAAVEQMIRSATPAGLAANLRGLALRPDATAILPTIRVPTLVISGSEDVISPPEEMRSWANQIPGSHFVTIANVGHLSPLESQGEFNQCLAEFLRDTLG